MSGKSTTCTHRISPSTKDISSRNSNISAADSPVDTLDIHHYHCDFAMARADTRQWPTYIYTSMYVGARDRGAKPTITYDYSWLSIACSRAHLSKQFRNDPREPNASRLESVPRSLYVRKVVGREIRHRRRQSHRHRPDTMVHA